LQSVVILHKLKQIFCSPAGLTNCYKVLDPRRDLRVPVRSRSLLHVPDHRSESVVSTMKTGLEPLDAPCGTAASDDVFTFVPIAALGCRQPLAFDGEQRIKVDMSTALDPNRGSTRRCSQVNRPTSGLLIWHFRPKLEKIQAGVPGSAVEVSAKCRCQRGLRGLWLPITAVAPARQLDTDEVKQFIKGRSRQMNILVERARPRGWVSDVRQPVYQNPCARRSARVSSASRRATDRSQ